MFFFLLLLLFLWGPKNGLQQIDSDKGAKLEGTVEGSSEGGIMSSELDLSAEKVVREKRCVVEFDGGEGVGKLALWLKLSNEKKIFIRSYMTRNVNFFRRHVKRTITQMRRVIA